MRTGKFIIVALASGLLCTSAFGCERSAPEPSAKSSDAQPSQKGSDTPSVWLEADGMSVSVRATRGRSGVGARMMELIIEASRPVVVARHEAGDAAARAQKKVIVQQRDETHLRVIVFASDNVAELDDGTIATLDLESEGSGPLTLEILTERPIFAPAGANDGLKVGEPIIL